MVDLLFAGDESQLRTKGIVKTVYDPACGTGGMLSIAEEYLRELNPDGQLAVSARSSTPSPTRSAART